MSTVAEMNEINRMESVERQREIYASKTNEQLIMIALHYALNAVSRGHDPLLQELLNRASSEVAKEIRNG